MPDSVRGSIDSINSVNRNSLVPEHSTQVISYCPELQLKQPDSGCSYISNSKSDI